VVPTLTSTDRFALITFNGLVRTVIPLTLMDDAGQKKALQQIHNLHANGGTNICQALDESFMLHKNNSRENTQKVILFVTDGDPTEGEITHPDSIIKYIGDKHNSSDVTVNVFGIGTDVKAKFLKDIADKFSGMYFFIETPSQIEAALGDCVGGTHNICAKKIQVRFDSNVQGGLVVSNALTTGHIVRKYNNGVAVDVSGVIYWNGTRDIMFVINGTSIPKSKDGALVGNINYVSPTDEDHPINVPFSLTIIRKNETVRVERDEIDIEMFRIEMAETMETLPSLPRIAAKACLELMQTTLIKSRVANHQTIKGFLRTIQECLDRTQTDNDYATRGVAYCTSTSSAYTQQVSTGLASPYMSSAPPPRSASNYGRSNMSSAPMPVTTTTTTTTTTATQTPQPSSGNGSVVSFIRGLFGSSNKN